MYFILQVESPSLVGEVVSNSGSLSWRIVLFSLLSYLICAGIQYVLSLLLKKRDVRNNRQMKITDITIEKEMELFSKLDHLRTFQKGEGLKMLNELECIRELLGHNQLMYRKGLSKIADELTDYFSVLCTDFSKRDMKKEINLFNKYRDQFYS